MWIINKSDAAFDVFIQEELKFITFKPKHPVWIQESRVGLKYIDRYPSLIVCEKPENYFSNDNPFNQLIIRDAGIGDLLLLEPVLRALNKDKNRKLSVLTRYPEVYENHPDINETYFASTKESFAGLKREDFDDWVDLRSYSETTPERRSKHRTDIYNQKFRLDIKDKEPRLYFNKKEKVLLKKKAGYTYIGFAPEASHKYRGFYKIREMIDCILTRDKKNILVLFGADKKNVLDIKKNKRIIDLRNKTNIREAINYVRGLDYMLSVDSGLMHVALSLHIPTVAIFSIITPDFRLRYYTGPHAVITGEVDCIGCGDFHMVKCSKGNGSTIPPCMNLETDHIYNTLMALSKDKTIEHIAEKKTVNIIPHSKKKLKMPFMTMNEEVLLERFIDNVIRHPAIGEVICIDGGSADNTVKILEKAGVKVFIHPYMTWYHEQQAMQRNISCSYAAEGEKIIIMDPDECFSQELSDYLFTLAESNIQYGLISRRTFRFYKDIQDPAKSIKQYPDYQPRFYTWSRKYKFVGGAHHVTLNTPDPVRIDKDILHFEEEAGKREGLEKQWAGMMKKVKELA